MDAKKQFHRIGSAVVTIALLILSACSGKAKQLDSNYHISTEVQSSNEEFPTGLNCPDEIEVFTDDPTVAWSAGIFVYLYNQEINEDIMSPAYMVYHYDGGEIDARIDIGSNIDRKQSFSIMIVADGRPISFSLEDKTSQSHEVTIHGGTQSIRVHFDPEFSSGRVDFLLLYQGDVNIEYYSSYWTIYLGDMAAEAEIDSADLIEAAEQIVPVRHMANGYSLFGILREPFSADENFSYSGGTEFVPGDRCGVLLDLVSGYEGIFRTTCFADNNVLPFTLEGHSFESFVWKSSSETMIHRNIELDLDDWEGKIFYTVSVPLERKSIDKPPLVSVKYRLKEAQ